MYLLRLDFRPALLALRRFVASSAKATVRALLTDEGDE